MKDRTDEAIATLANIQAGGNINDPLVVAEWEEISEVLTAERNSGSTWSKFTRNGMWKRTLAGFTVQMWQQNAGANVRRPCSGSKVDFRAYVYAIGNDILW